MNTQLEQKIDQKELLEKEIKPMLLFAENLEIETAEDRKAAEEWLKESERKKKVYAPIFAEPREKAYRAYEAMKNLENTFMKPFETVKDIIKKKLNAWDMEVIRQRRIEEARIEAERREAERKERERLEKQAAKAEQKGQVDKAELLKEQAQNITVMPEIVPPSLTESVKKTTWKARVVDPKEACRAVLNGEIPADAVSFAQSSLNALAMLHKNTKKIPGIEIYEEVNSRIRA